MKHVRAALRSATSVGSAADPGGAGAGVTGDEFVTVGQGVDDLGGIGALGRDHSVEALQLPGTSGGRLHRAS